MKRTDEDNIRKAVRNRYSEVARAGEGCCGASSCCSAPAGAEVSVGLGYSREDLATVPEGANMGLGCGNPRAIASLRKGETVLDLGSGGGFDCFLAARQVGSGGRVIGVEDFVVSANITAVKPASERKLV